ncbi:MAG: methylated-DNA--[protein]-cysteine S-methyltransferase [Enhydrobacter sp.]|nr:MAG: methylated-DNA--[protein]-cysteine S-methyltransferase [Enhydrobacter sp.]
MTLHFFALFDTPIGACAVRWTGQRIAGLQLPESTPASTRRRALKRWPGARESMPAPDIQRAIDRVVALLRGERIDLGDIELDLSSVPDFHREVYDVARSVPAGQTITYGEIARRLGVPHEAREVGQALGRNPVAIIVPCHRVLGADGKMGGFSAAGGVVTKRRILEIEAAAALSAGPLFVGRAPHNG